mgnify:CR=1 FL=1
MTTFKHKTLPITIDYSEYSKLPQSEKNNFNIVNTSQNTTNNISTTNINSETKDLLGVGQAVEAVVAVPVLIVGGLFGLFD